VARRSSWFKLSRTWGASGSLGVATFRDKAPASSLGSNPNHAGASLTKAATLTSNRVAVRTPTGKAEVRRVIELAASERFGTAGTETDPVRVRAVVAAASAVPRLRALTRFFCPFVAGSFASSIRTIPYLT
jgi:hypothetical protein